MAAISSETQIQRMLKRSEELKDFDLGALDGALERASRHPGAGALRRALDAYRPDLATTRSKLERRFRALARRAGLPEPAMNYLVAGLELDAYWEAERFVVELDVYGTHGDPGSFERDRLREDDLLLLGIEMMRVTDTRLERESRATIERVAAHLARRRRELAPGPP
jgi:very-short-patch-repair endonuclease